MEKSKGGRKPYKDRAELKVQLPVYLKQAHINKLGGNTRTRELIESYILTQVHGL